MSCPTCGAPDWPPLRTCASETCQVAFRRSAAGRADAIYCTRKCAHAQAARQYRRRRRDAAEARAWIGQFMDDYDLPEHVRVAFGMGRFLTIGRSSPWDPRAVVLVGPGLC